MESSPGGFGCDGRRRSSRRSRQAPARRGRRLPTLRRALVAGACGHGAVVRRASAPALWAVRNPGRRRNAPPSVRVHLRDVRASVSLRSNPSAWRTELCSVSFRERSVRPSPPRGGLGRRERSSRGTRLAMALCDFLLGAALSRSHSEADLRLHRRRAALAACRSRRFPGASHVGAPFRNSASQHGAAGVFGGRSRTRLRSRPRTRPRRLG